MGKQPPNADEIWDAWAAARSEKPGLRPVEFVARFGTGGPAALEALSTLLELEESEPPPPLVDVGPGAVFAGFRLIQVLGEGSAGIVFEAVDERETGSGARVALKALNPLVTVGAERRRTILREAEIAARLSHEGIVRVLESGVERGYTWIATELVEGVPLSEWIGTVTGADAVAAAIDVGLQVASALEHAHAQGVVHRDVKPANIIRTPEGRVRLLDFGLARVEGAAFAISRSGSTIGTPLYMAPEQLRGERTVGPPADLYALGIIMLEVSRGRRLATREQAMQTLARIARGRFRLPRRLLRGIPGPLGDIISRCLEPMAEDRYTGATLLITDLEAARDGGALQVGRLGRVRRIWRRGNRNRVRSLSVVIGAAAIAWFAVRLLTPDPVWEARRVHHSISDGDGFGGSMAGGRDLDGDLVPDYAVTASRFDAEEGADTDEGAVWVYSGRTGEVLHTLYGSAAGDTLGRVEFLPDFDGDGCPELVLAAPQDTSSATKRGYVSIVSGRSDDEIRRFEGEEDGDLFGTNIHVGGDVDGDGHPDLIVGARQYYRPGQYGYARVYSGKTLEKLHEVRGQVLNGSFGNSVCIIGDLDFDGRDEFAVGAYTAYDGEGRVYVYSGDTGDLACEITGPSGLLGSALQPAGDFDGDGCPDLIAGTRGMGAGGSFHCFSVRDYRVELLFTHAESVRGGAVGGSVTYLGDVDGDGVSDFAAGSQADFAVVVSGADGTEILRVEGDTPWASVASAGDVDGDGLLDVLVGFRSDANDPAYALGSVRLFATSDRPKN